MKNENNHGAVLLVVLAAQVMMPIIGQSLTVALPAMGKSLSVNPIVLGWISISLLLSIAVFAVPAGRIADMYGRKKIFLLGVVICTTTSFLLAASHSVASLIFYRAVQGIGGAMVLNTSIVIISSIYPTGRRGKMLGICLAATYIGQTLAPILGGFLTHYFGWRSIFLINVPLGLFIIGFTLWKIDAEWVGDPGQKFDIPGAIILGTMLVAIIYGLSAFPSKLGFLLLLTGLSLGVVFIKWETKTAAPILDMNLFKKNRIFSISILTALIFYSAVFSAGFLLSLFMQYAKGFTPKTAGFILVVQPVFQAAFSPLAGKFADRVKTQFLPIVGMVLTASGLFLFTLIEIETNMASIFFGLFLIGCGWAFFVTTNMNDAMGTVDSHDYGNASGTIATIRQIGMMVSMALTMLIFSLYIGKSQVAPEQLDLFLKSVKTAFVCLTILCLTGLLALAFRGKMKRAHYNFRKGQ